MSREDSCVVDARGNLFLVVCEVGRSVCKGGVVCAREGGRECGRWIRNAPEVLVGLEKGGNL